MVLLILEAMRPRQWIKNGIIFAGLLFSRRFAEPGAVAIVCGVFLTFCALSGAIYLFNDVIDAEEDRRHELKRKRPVASGRLSPSKAIAAGIILSGVSLGGAYSIGIKTVFLATAYFLLLFSYTCFLKHVVIVDVLVVALGFVLRAVVGGVAIGVEISPWLLICTILLALFLVLSKRRHEILLLEDDARYHRPILAEYSTYLLDQMIAVVSSSTLMAYVLYTLAPRTRNEVSSHLFFTIPFVLYGIFRYLWLVHQKDEGGSPERVFLSDRPLLCNVVCWVLTVLLILWRG